ncbi:MAG: amino acid adenylation domain-containing protein [Nitrospinae bacterium]|nr:amino acid adenylation domain-containing protein [Nitrospinota bacterium]
MSEETVETFVFPMSYSQRRLWFLEQMEPGSAAYHIPAALLMEGKLDTAALEKSLKAIVERHEPLRTTFKMVEGEPCQVIGSKADVSISIMDAAQWPEGERMDIIRRLVAEKSARPFDLAAGPLLRVTLIKAGENKSVLALVMHHIISDGWSMGVLIKEFSENYSAFVSGQEPQTPELAIQYADYSEWQRGMLEGDAWAGMLEYWKNTLHGAPPFLDLPADRQRSPLKTYNGAMERFNIGAGTFSKLDTLCRGNSASLFMCLFAAFSALVSRYTQKEDMVLATLLANRNREELEPIIGFFVNTLPLRLDMSGDPSFQQLLEKARRVCMDAFAHQDAPFDKLVESLNPERNLGHTPIVNVMMTLQNTPGVEFALPGLAIKPFEGAAKISARFDLELYLWEGDGALRGDFIYNTDLFDASRIKRMAGHFVRLLSDAAENPSKRISLLGLLDDEERGLVTTTWNDTGFEYPRERRVHQLFEENAARHPDKAAVRTGDASMTYSELNSAANRVARAILSKGAVRNEIVGVMMKRSAETLGAILGILKAGCAYLPLDTKYPRSRIEYMLVNAGARIVVTDGSLGGTLPGFGGEIINVKDEWISGMDAANPDIVPASGDLAYVIYTSGSTGLPKGAGVEHGGLMNYIWWAKTNYAKEGPVDFPLFTSLSFDLTVTSIFTPLVSGGAVAVYPEDDASDGSILKVIDDNMVDVIKLTPSHLALMAMADLSKSKLRRLVLGGEELKTSLAGRIHTLTGGRVEIINEYGPTETTVGCMIHIFDPEKATGKAVPIGKPAGNVKLYILDGSMNPMPIGVPGELYISGDGAARGYVNNPGLTAERFLDDPFVPGGRMYKSGDVAYWREDGVMELIGRADGQVKVQGYRIEPGEIESAILSFDGVKECVVDVTIHSGAVAVPEGGYCAECGLPYNYPGAAIGADGVCGACRDFNAYKEKAEGYFKTPADLETLFRDGAPSANGSYDCLALYSGGKDSTYMLFKLAEMGLKILAFTFDNGYLYEGAKENIRRVAEKLGIDHVFSSTPHINAILADSLRRYSNVCNECFKVVYTLGVKVAKGKGIKRVVTGLSRGQLYETRLAELFRAEVFGEEEIERAVMAARRLYHRMDDAVATLMDVSLLQDGSVLDEMRFVDFYRYTGVTREQIMGYLTQNAPWINPAETSGCTTNCRINDAGIFVHSMERGYNNYALPNSWEVRLGHKKREESIKELESPLDMESVRTMLKQIGYDARGAGDGQWKRLVAYYTSDRPVAPEEMRGSLAGRLPEFMIPSKFVRLEKMPLTVNGKVDKKELARLGQGAAPAEKRRYEKPTNIVEEKIAEIWTKGLGLEKVGIGENFFELGGHSLMATQVVSRLRAEFSVDLPLISIFEKPTVAQLAELVIQAQLAAMDGDELEALLDEADRIADE